MALICKVAKTRIIEARPIMEVASQILPIPMVVWSKAIGEPLHECLRRPDARLNFYVM